LTHTMYKSIVNCSFLNEYLDFLIKQVLVEKRIIGKHIVFAITQSGLNVLKYFRELVQVLLIIEETQRKKEPLLY
jgi:predicted transcriptional regulator